MKLQTLFKEIEAGSPLAMRRLLSILPDPDPIFQKQGRGLAAYRELLYDSHVWACVQSRKAGVLSLEWKLEGPRTPARRLRQTEMILDHLDLHHLISEILNAPLWGFQPLEVYWTRSQGLILPEKVLAKPPEWFAFEKYDKLVLAYARRNARELPPYKILTPRNQAGYQNPYGEKVLSRVFWPVTFKKGGLKFWVLFTEKFGMPHVVGKLPRGKNKQEYDDLLDLLMELIQDAVAVIPDDASVELKEAAGKAASAGIYHELVNLCNTEISKAILGQTLSTEVGDKGSYAASKSHMDVRQNIIDADKKLVEQTINTLIQWIYEINFNTEPPKFHLYEQEEIDKTRAERDQILVNTGIRFTPEYYQKAYNLDEKDFQPAGPAQPQASNTPQGPAFASPPGFAFAGAPLDTARAEALASQPAFSQNLMRKMLQPIIDKIHQGASYTDILENLAEMYPRLNADELENLLTRLIFIAETQGRMDG